MSLTADAAPAVHSCSQCRQVFASPKALRRHVTLDHTADPEGADLLVAALGASGRVGTLPSDPPEAGAANPPAALGRAARSQRPVPSPARWAHRALGAYMLGVLITVNPVLALVLVTVAGLVVLLRSRAAAGSPDARPSEPDGPQPGDRPAP